MRSRLPSLPEVVRARVDAGTLAVRSAAEIARLDGPEIQERVARATEEGGLKRDEVAELVQAVKARRPAPARASCYIAALHLELDDVAGYHRN